MATSFYLNSTASTLRHEILKNGFSVPGGQNLTEAQLDHYTRQYLQALVDNKLVTLAITDDVVKVYRNYAILYTLDDVIKQVYTCVTGI
ncbi:hypothetical protein OS493_012196 [Desmophyllum pertusum]|uniref:Uncharacterized protein n=1 Tax=Desmophyllum pertusum TaxID=174260 RepID=A0A9X0A3T6_9CNID|nr:hypothetical protein OS493_012196 [Desmophyllum pertusum]